MEHCQKIDEEISINESNWAKVKGQEIKFGQVIQLLHVNSNKYLRYNSETPAYFEPENYAVLLSEEYSEETSFRIHPCFTLERQ